MGISAIDSCEPTPPKVGSPLTESDYATLTNSWIAKEFADMAMLRRVTSEEGNEILGQRGSRDYSGVLIPYYRPDEAAVLTYRIRRDNPILSNQGKGSSGNVVNI